MWCKHNMIFKLKYFWITEVLCYVSEAFVTALYRRCPNITELTLIRCCLSAHELPLVRFPKTLKKLSLLASFYTNTSQVRLNPLEKAISRLNRCMSWHNPIKYGSNPKVAPNSSFSGQLPYSSVFPSKTLVLFVLLVSVILAIYLNI